MKIILFNKSIHDRNDFDCGEVKINKYFKQQLSQDIKSNACRCYVLQKMDAQAVIGFITLSASSIKRSNIDNDMKKKFPRYSRIPSILIGRMGVDKKYQGNNYGDLLVLKAFDIAKELSVEVGISLIEVQAKNENLIRFYKRLGFILLETINKDKVLVKKV